ncbi:hypothetical protein MJO29_005264 [Puccinia striiformis f. sp. tritici]|nr:hypothetical protein MJO29_005264 [Puccinia striiformis f. sp. tritici]
MHLPAANEVRFILFLPSSPFYPPHCPRSTRTTGANLDAPEHIPHVVVTAACGSNGSNSTRYKDNACTQFPWSFSPKRPRQLGTRIMLVPSSLGRFHQNDRGSSVQALSLYRAALDRLMSSTPADIPTSPATPTDIPNASIIINRSGTGQSTHHTNSMVFVAYTVGTKIHAIRMLLQGKSETEIRQTLEENISRQSFARWLELYDQTRSVIRDPNTYEKQGRPSLLSPADRQFMIDLVAARPGLFLDEIREYLYDADGPLLSIEAIQHNLVHQLQITLKKPSTLNNRKCLVAKFAYVEKTRFIPAEFFVFTDECTICDRDLLRSLARSPKGQPSARFIVRQNAERISLLPAIGIDGVMALALTENTFTGKKFQDYLEWDLIPRMNPYPGPNSILVCDNAKIHKGSRISEICAEAGILLMYLPPYCPELNPIELCFSAFKYRLRRSQILTDTTEPIWDIRETFDEVVTSQLCYSYYSHCGYSVPPL